MRYSSDKSSETPRVSLITVALNGGDGLARTFKSVFAQDYQPIDYIVIDGGSTDGSVELIKRHEARLAYWISEPDHGISDAFNKGINAASGDLIGFLNADDWLSPNQITEAVKALQASDASFVFGDLLYHAPDGTCLHKITGDQNYAAKIGSGMPALNHPTLLAKRAVFDDIGGFDEHYQVAMDYDWILRAHRTGHRGVYAKTVLGHMTLAGVSDQLFIKGLTEVRQIATWHGAPSAQAWLLFSLRVIKGSLQRILRCLLPASLYHRLRQGVNADYQFIGASLSACPGQDRPDP